MTTADVTKLQNQLELTKKDMKYMKTDLTEMKKDIKEIKELLFKQEEKFISKSTIKTWITVACAVIVAAVAVANYYSK